VLIDSVGEIFTRLPIKTIGTYPREYQGQKIPFEGGLGDDEISPLVSLGRDDFGLLYQGGV
jgi:hypothetical protein